jgi:hypothetical protein
VCVAGLYLPPEGPPEHIRLYPIPFRYLAENQQFKKYEIRTFEIFTNSKDNRPESRKVNLSSQFPCLNFLPPWKKRAEIVEQVERQTMCAMNRAAVSGQPGPSLGLVDPLEVLGIDIEETPPPTAEQREKRERLVAQQQLDLFDEPVKVVRDALEDPPLKAWLKYRCKEPDCSTIHRQGILDWELTALQRHRQQRDGASLDQLRKDIEKNFLEVPIRRDRALSLFVGNQADPRKRGTFSVLGLYYPERKDLPPAAAPLFS